MKTILGKPTSLGFLFLAVCSVYACAQDASSVAKTHSGEVVFASPEQGSWRKVFYLKNGVSQQLFSGDSAYFDESEDADFSWGKKYLKINKIIRGFLQGGGTDEEYERAYCVFIEMSSGCVVRQETGSFCGGEWASNGDAWIWGGEEIIIDERDPHKPLSDSDIERLSDIGGRENISRCISPK